MYVRELVELLSKLPQDMLVESLHIDTECATFYSIETVVEYDGEVILTSLEREDFMREYGLE